LIPASGGLRKLRIGVGGKGKRGGGRVIYFFHNPGMPIFMLAGYTKSEKVDLTRSELKAARDLARQLVEIYRR
jgi:hypothetical protein